MNTVLNLIEGIDAVGRAGVNVTASRLSSYLAQSQPKTKKWLDHLESRGIVVRTDYMYRSNCKSSMYRLSERGKVLMSAIKQCNQLEMPF